MSKIETLGTYTIPAWALPYLINGDASGLDGEEQQADEWTRDAFPDHDCLTFESEGSEYFAPWSAFGPLGDTCVDVTVHGHPKALPAGTISQQIPLLSPPADVVGYEVRPCRDSSDDDGTPRVEECEADEAQFWGLYEVRRDHIPHLRDYPTEKEARDACAKLTALLPPDDEE